MSKKVTVKETDRTKKKNEEQIESENQKLMDAFGDTKERVVDPEKLEALKAKLANKNKSEKEEVSMPDLVSKRQVSIDFGVIGVGQAGSRIAEQFHREGYDVGVINTSAQDLEYIELLPNQKLLLDKTLGGTGKSLELSREVFTESEDEIKEFVDNVLEGCNMAMLAVSGGGGTGSGSVETMVSIMFETGLPVGVIYVLPKATEDAQSKINSVETLSRLARMTADNMVSTLVVVDNARIEQIYGGLSQSEFWKTANKAIVEPISIFNSLTSQPSKFTSLDPSDFGKIISCGDCSVYGVIDVYDYEEETALAEAVIESLSGNMLAEGFDLSQTRTGGVIIAGSEEALNKVKALSIDYCFSMLSEQTNGANIFQGIYSVDGIDGVKIYSWFAGLGLPQDRIDNLKKESKAQTAIAAEKEKHRASSMVLDLEEDKVMSAKEEIERKIRKKKSGFNKLQGRGSIIDKRRKR